MKQTVKRIRRWHVLLCLVLMTSLIIPFRSVFAVAGQVDANNTTTAPTIDGNINESGWNLANSASKTTIGTPNNTVTLGAMWDNTNLYVAVRVLDANLFNDSANSWEDDSVEIYIDANNNAGSTYDSFDRQYVKGYNDSSLSSIGSMTGVSHATAAISGGYSVELAIPWSNLGVSATPGMLIGFDIGSNDDDNAGTREHQSVWWGTMNNYNNTSAFGDLLLVPAGGVTNTPTRTPTSVAGQTAYPSGVAWAIPGTIQAEDFDLGGETVAYHDLEVANQGGQYRTGDGVDIGVSGDTGGGYNVGWTRTDEWLEYTVNVATAGNYTLTERVASGATTGSFRVEFNGVNKTGTVTTPNTGGWQTYQNLSQTVNLSAGVQVMRIYFMGNDTNLNYVTLATAGGPTSTFTRTPTATNTCACFTNTPTRTPTPSNTPVGPTATFTRTATPTATFTRTSTPTNTPVGPTATFTRTPTPGTSTNLALGKPITASSSIFTFVPGNANDGNLTTYWEGNGLPASLTVDLTANANINSIVIKLNPATSWGARTQTLQVLSHDQSTGTFSNLVSSATYSFNPATGNTVTIPVSTTASAVQLNFTANTGAGSGQVAEFEIYGVMAPNPDLTITGITWSPASPSEVNAITLNATVQNIGSAASPASTINFNVGGAAAGSAAVPALNAGASSVVSLNIGTKAMGSYSVAATVDPTNAIVEQNNSNNTFTASTQLVVTQAPGPDLQILSVSANPQSPAVGAAVTFTVAINNRGTTGVAANTTTRVVVGSTTLNVTNTPAIAAGATVNVNVGTWTAVNGLSTATATADATNIIAETNESNNSMAQTIVVGRGAAVPYIELEAENASYNGTLLTADALRTFGHNNFATESSGRKSVRLDSTGQFVEFTSTAPANSIVIRNSIPDAAGGGGIQRTISLYVTVPGGSSTFLQKITLSSTHSWLYGNTDQPEGLSNTPSADARRLFDESHALLATSYPAGTKFKLQRDSGDTATFYIIDFIDLEQVAPPLSMPAGCTSITAYGAIPNDGLDDTAALQAAVTADQNGAISCVWIPAGQWRQEQKILTDDPLNRGQWNQVGISNVTIRGAGMWHSQLYTTVEPQNVVGGINHPHEGNFGFDIDNNVQISDIAIFGSGRIRGGDGNAEGGVGLNGRFGQNTVISNVWIEHANVGAWVGRDYDNIQALWGPGINLQFSGMRIRNTYADGINFTNGTRLSTVFNSSFRNTGDDALAVWANMAVKDSTIDITHDNHFINNTIQLPWRANGIAIYGGYGNTIENNLISDTMNYPGIMLATDHSPLPFSGTTLIANNGLYRCGGVFWNEDQEFGAITLFPSTSAIVGVTIRDTDIIDSTYDGIQFKNGGGQMPNVQLINVNIDKSNNGAGILAMSGANGNAVRTNVTITNSADGHIVIQPGSQFIIN